MNVVITLIVNKKNSVSLLQNPTGTTLAPSTLKACSYCKTYFPTQSITALAECQLSCNEEDINCDCGATTTTVVPTRPPATTTTTA